METSTIIYLLQSLSIFLAGAFFGTKYTLYRLHKALEEAGVDFEEEEKVDIKKFFVENCDGLLYLYEHPTNKFICQGKLLTELASLSNKYDKAEVACVINYDKEVVWFINGEVRKELNAG
jgi:hypothetical protein